MTSVLSSSLSRTMAMTASSLDGPVDVDELLHLICLAAIDSVPGAEYAGITIADRHGKLETPAATHQLVHEVDELQYRFRQGPCVDAVGGRWQARSDDLSVDIRWPLYGPHTAATVLLVLGVPERTVMGIMGWSSTGMAACYQHVSDPIRRSVAKLVDGLIWASDE